MNLGDDRAIKTTNWFSNMILRADDMMIGGQSDYQNITDQLALMAKQKTVDEVLSGLELTPTALLSCNLSAGAAVSFAGKYVTVDSWGFTAGAGDIFSVINPKDQVVGFATAHATLPRIDILEIRPVETEYNEESRQFKDPITDSITSSLTNTRKEYGVEAQVITGTAGTLIPEHTVFTCLDGYIPFENKYLLLSTPEDDYYVWFNVDSGGTDPLVAGRTAIEATVISGVHTTATWMGRVIEAALETAIPTQVNVYDDGGGVVTIENLASGTVTDATIGNIDISDLTVSITQQGSGGAPASTAGWIKVAEVYVSATQTVLTDMDIRTWKGSTGWIGSEVTLQPLEMTEDVSIDVPAAWPRDAIHNLWASQPKNFNGHSLTLRFTAGTYDVVGGDLEFNDAYNGRLILQAISGTPVFDMNGATFDILQDTLNGKLDIEISDFDIFDGYFYSVGVSNSSIELTDFNVDPQTNGGFSPITIRAYNQIVFTTCNVTTAVTPSYRSAVQLGQCPLVRGLPTMTGNLGEYHLDLFDCNIANTDFLVSGTLGDIYTGSSKYVLLDGVQYNNSISKKAVAGLAVDSWKSRTSPANYAWQSVAWSPSEKCFVAVCYDGTTQQAMHSPNGVNWTLRNTPNTQQWIAVEWAPSLGLFCAVSYNGTTQQVMTSPDGLTWTARTTPATSKNWQGLTWSEDLGLFVAVAAGGTGQRVMTSSNGTSWTLQTTPADYNWFDVTWSPELGLFCAVANSGTTQKVMTSPNGTSWTLRTTAGTANWISVEWSPKLRLFVATGQAGTDNIMTSPNGVNWTSGDYSDVSTSTIFQSVVWSPELDIFVATGYNSTPRIMTSLDGVNWVGRTVPVSNDWLGCCWSPELGMFCATSITGTGDRVMTTTQLF